MNACYILQSEILLQVSLYMQLLVSSPSYGTMAKEEILPQIAGKNRHCSDAADITASCGVEHRPKTFSMFITMKML